MKALVDAVYTRLQPLTDDTDPAYAGAEEVIVRGAKLPTSPAIIIEPPETPQQDETLDGYRFADTVLSVRVHTTHTDTQVEWATALTITEAVEDALRDRLKLIFQEADPSISQDEISYDAYLAPPSKTPQQVQHEDKTAFDYVLTFPSVRFPHN